MKDIQKAVLLEEKYLYNKLNSIIELPLVSLLLEAGYDNIEEYFFDKTSYMIKQLSFAVFSGDMLDIPQVITEDIKNNTNAIYLPYAKNNFIWHGTENIDLEECKRLNIDILDMNYNGGNIVSGPEDFSMGILLPNTIDVSLDYFLVLFADIYKKYFSNVIIDNNDIMINNQKIQGSIFFEANNMFFYGTEITFSDKSNLIQKFCHKEQEKIPGYIDSSILSKDKLQEEILQWLR